MLKNATNTAFTVSELLRENQRRGGLGVGGGGRVELKTEKVYTFCSKIHLILQNSKPSKVIFSKNELKILKELFRLILQL